MRGERAGALKILSVALVVGFLLAAYCAWLVQGLPDRASGSLYGGGASFLNPQMQAWALRYYKLTDGRVAVNYQSLGSGAGQAKFRAGLLDFVGSDPPLRPRFLEELKRDPERGGALQFPVIIGSVAVVYNLPGVGGGELRLSGELLAKICLGEVSYWDDPEILELNPGLKGELPHERIIFVHRSDGSGTTKIFTTYLSLVSERWAEEVGADFTVQWPVDAIGNGVGGKGNEGVAAAIQQTPYSMGYVELSYVDVGGLKVAKLRNRAGRFVLPEVEAAKAAAAAISPILPEPDEDWSWVLEAMINPEGEDSYPLISFSFIILNKRYPADKAALIRDFFRWVLTEGQKLENIVEGYIPIPPEVAEVGLKALEMIEEV